MASTTSGLFSLRLKMAYSCLGKNKDSPIAELKYTDVYNFEHRQTGKKIHNITTIMASLNKCTKW
jgi:hypothetical protein